MINASRFHPKLFRTAALALSTTAVFCGISSEATCTSAAAEEKPRVVLLGFDGVDYTLAQQWMDSGELPHLKQLAENGTYLPLTTSNPAQSPVAWAEVVTGSNPGKTNIGDFVRRIFTPSGAPMPRLAGVQVRPEGVPADELGDYVQLSSSERLRLSLGSGRNRLLALGLLFGALLLIVTMLFRVVLRLNNFVSLGVGLLVAAGGAYGGHVYISGLPTKYPVSENEMLGARFWDVLGKAGIRVKGIDVPEAFPCSAHSNVSILGGLNTPDIAGGIGSWYIYTNDEWSMNEDSTSSGGTVYKLWEDDDGVIRAKLKGPEDFVSKYKFADRKAELSAQVEDEVLDAKQRSELAKQLEGVKNEERTWRQYERYKMAEMEVRPDFERHVVNLTVNGQSQDVAQGEYSDFFQLSFDLTSNHRMRALARVLVQECFTSDDEEPRLRLFVPSISISPEDVPPHLPISTPPDYAEELADAVGLFDTVGWDGYTNPLKDLEISEQAFMQGVDHLFTWREALLMHELEQDDWEVLFHTEYGTDRTAHMMFRFFDPGHPHFNDKDKEGNLIREQEITAFGRTFKVTDCIKETYRQMDLIVGRVMEKIESGSLGPNVKLMLISDHGFQSYRYGVNLNVWLNRMGYLARKGEGDEIGAEDGIGTGRDSGSVLSFVDWPRTRAYSMGLGKIYINLKGREGEGIVERSEYDALKREIIEKLLAFRDPVEGHENAQVVVNAYDALEVCQGPIEENITDYGDIILGFNKYYRVSGSTSSGGYDRDSYDTFGIANNDEPWSGDHCGVDMPLVRGVFYANFDVGEGAAPGLKDVAPTILEMFGVGIPEEWDGTAVPLK